MKLTIELEEVENALILRINDSTVVLNPEISVESLKKEINSLIDKCEYTCYNVPSAQKGVFIWA